MMNQAQIVTSLNTGDRAGKPLPDSRWPGAWVRLPLLVVCVLAVLLAALPEPRLRFAEAHDPVAHLLLLVMVPSMALVALAIELDVRLARTARPGIEGARESLAFATCFALALYVIWLGIAAEEAKVSYLTEIVFVGMIVLAVSAPLLWFTARSLVGARQRALLLGGFVAVTAAVELSFDLRGGEVEERMFTWHSLLIALALALRLGSWGLKEFRTTGD